MKRYFISLIVIVAVVSLLGGCATKITWQKDFEDGELHYQNGKYEEAINSYNKALAATDNIDEQIKILGRIAASYEAVPDYDKALDIYNAILGKTDDVQTQITAYFNIADVYEKKKDFTNALNTYTHIIESGIKRHEEDNNMIEAYRKRSNIRVRMGDYPGALQDSRLAGEIEDNIRLRDEKINLERKNKFLEDENKKLRDENQQLRDENTKLKQDKNK